MYEIYTREIFMQCSEAFTESNRIFCWKDYKIQGKQFKSTILQDDQIMYVDKAD